MPEGAEAFAQPTEPRTCRWQVQAPVTPRHDSGWGWVLGEAGMSKRASVSRILQDGEACQGWSSWSLYAGPRLAHPGQIPVETEGMSPVLLPVVGPSS